MPVHLIDPATPTQITVGVDKKNPENSNPTEVLFTPLTFGQKMKLGALVDTDKPFTSDIEQLMAVMVESLQHIEGINEPITADVLQRIDDVSIFWEIAGAMIKGSALTESTEGN